MSLRVLIPCRVATWQALKGRPYKEATDLRFLQFFPVTIPSPIEILNLIFHLGPIIFSANRADKFFKIIGNRDRFIGFHWDEGDHYDFPGLTLDYFKRK
jgi:hypothetical protein